MKNAEASAAGSPKLRVALISCALGNIFRGFESTTANWARALRSQAGVDARLFSCGRYPGATRVPAFARNGRVCDALRAAGRIHDGARVEQVTFSLAFIPHLLAWRPDVLWIQEEMLGRCLLAIRRMLRLDFRICFCNGAPIGPDSYHRFDFIQHLSPGSHADAIRAGISADRMAVFPHVLFAPALPSLQARSEARRILGVPADRRVVLSAAAWNRHHKRIDYLIREIAALKDRNVHLLLCGHPEPETAGLKELASEMLGDRVTWRTLDAASMPQAYAAADVFALCSLNEAFGLVLTEAASHGLPVFAHAHDAARFILEDEAWLCDLSSQGDLAPRLREFLEDPDGAGRAARLRQRVLERFGEEFLTSRFVDLLRSVATAPLQGRA